MITIYEKIKNIDGDFSNELIINSIEIILIINNSIYYMFSFGPMLIS